LGPAAITKKEKESKNGPFADSSRPGKKKKRISNPVASETLSCLCISELYRDEKGRGQPPIVFQTSVGGKGGNRAEIISLTRETRHKNSNEHGGKKKGRILYHQVRPECGEKGGRP